MRNDALDRAFEALADPTRRGVIKLLRKSPRRAGELAARLDMSAPALSRHLRILRESRLVEEVADEHDGRVSIYRLRREVFARLRTWVDAVESLWQDQLTAFAEHVARTRAKGTP
jgi:DNA-binding transcriptional ArsR family regulator